MFLSGILSGLVMILVPGVTVHIERTIRNLIPIRDFNIPERNMFLSGMSLGSYGNEVTNGPLKSTTEVTIAESIPERNMFLSGMRYYFCCGL